MAGLNLAAKAMRHYVSSALDVIIQIARLSDGTRKLISFQEVVGMEGDLITLQELFTFNQTGLDENRKVKGRFKATGVRPKFAERLEAKGIRLSADSSDRLGYFWNDSPARTRACGRLSFVGAARVRSGCGKTSTVDGTKGRRNTGHCPKRYIERNTVA
jgi:hypothetical protein